MATQQERRAVLGVIKYADFQQVTRIQTLPAIVRSQETLRTVSIGLVRAVFPPAKGIRLIGVMVSRFDMTDRTGSEQFELDLGIR